MLVCYTLESRGHWFVLLFVVSCVPGSVPTAFFGGLAFWAGRGDLVSRRATALDHALKRDLVRLKRILRF